MFIRHFVSAPQVWWESVFIIFILILQELLGFFKWSVHFKFVSKIIPSMRKDFQKGISEFLRNSLWFPIVRVRKHID